MLSIAARTTIVSLSFISYVATANNNGASHHTLLRTRTRGQATTTRATKENHRRVISLPLIPHRNHPRYKDIIRDDDENNDRARRRYNRSRNRRFLAAAKIGLMDADGEFEEVEEIIEEEFIEEEEESIISDATTEDEQVVMNNEGSNTEPEFDTLYQGYGTHYVDLWVGTPPQRQTVIVDTGSSITAFPCSECHDCGSGYHVDGFFQENDSSTFDKLSCSDCMLGTCSAESSCHISMSYQEGSSWSAYEAKDVAYTGGPHDEYLPVGEDTTFPLRFGCQTSITGLFITQLADGIMGMEMEADTYWKQMYDSGAFDRRPKQFSLCYSRQPTAEMDGTQAGTMTFGGTDNRLHTTPMVYAKQYNTEGGWYVVKIKNIFLRWNGGNSVVVPDDVSKGDISVTKVQMTVDGLNNGNVIVDSGTTDTYLSSNLAQPFGEIWKQVTGTDYDNNGHSISEEQLLALPTVLIQLESSDDGRYTDDPDSTIGLVGPKLDPDNPNDILVSMPPTHYMEYSPSKGTYTSRLYFTEGHGGVLGANFIMGHDTLFNIDDSKIGFAESDCDYDSVLQQVEEAVVEGSEGEG